MRICGIIWGSKWWWFCFTSFLWWNAVEFHLPFWLVFFPTLSLHILPWKLPNPVKKHPTNNSEKVYRLGLWEIPQRIHHQISAPNGNDSRDVQGLEGRRKVKNLCSEAHYLNIQDCAGGLGHRVLMWGLPWGKATALSVRHSPASLAAKKGGTCPRCQGSKCSERSGHTQAYCEMKTSACLRGWSPRILQGNLQEAWPYIGTGCFPFEYALLSPPDNFLREGAEERGGNDFKLLAAFIDRLRKFRQGKKILQRFHRLTSEKVFHEVIAGLQTVTCCVSLQFSVLFLVQNPCRCGT